MMSRFVPSFLLVVALGGCGAPADLADLGADAAETERNYGQAPSPECTEVRAVRPGANGQLQVLATATVQADGRFVIRVGRHVQAYVLQAIDASGHVLASTLVEARGAVGHGSQTTPWSVETQIEAEVWAAASILAGAPCNTVDVRAWIDAQVAAAVEVSADRADTIHGLALAVLAAQRAEVQAWAELGIAVTQRSLLQAEASAALALNAALYAGASAEDASHAFYGELIDTCADYGATAYEAAQVAAQASLAFRATAEAMIHDALVLDAAVRACAEVEARFTAHAMAEVIAAAGILDARADAILYAAAELQAEVIASVDAAAAAAAWADFHLAVTGGGAFSNCGLDQLFEGSLLTELVLDASLQVCLSVAATLEATVVAATDAVIVAGADVDAQAMATAVVGTYGAWHDGLLGTALGVAGLASADAALAAEVITLAEGGFCAGE